MHQVHSIGLPHAHRQTDRQASRQAGRQAHTHARTLVRALSLSLSLSRRPDETFAVDWALKTNDISLFFSASLQTQPRYQVCPSSRS